MKTDKQMFDLLTYALPILEQAAKDTLELMPGTVGRRLAEKQQAKIEEIKTVLKSAK